MPASRAGTVRPRTSISTSVPATPSTDGTYAMPSAFSKVGLQVPLVTWPTRLPSCCTVCPSRAMPRPVTSKPTSLRGTPSRSCSRSATLPTKSPLSSFTTHESPASSGVVVSSSSWPESAAGAEAGGLDAVLGAGLEEALPQRRRRVGVDVELEAVLAGVAGARDDGAMAVDGARCEAVVLQCREVEVGQRLQDLHRLRPLQREERVAVGDVFHLGVTSGVALDPLEVALLVGRGAGGVAGGGWGGGGRGRPPRGAGGAHGNLPHVRDVEEAGGRAHRAVLL